MPRLHLIPLQSRHSSSREHVNLLFRDGPQENIYVSDNHRVAAWCWLQHLQAGDTVALFHIDRHSDTLRADLERRLEVLPPLPGLPLEAYLGAEYHGHAGSTPLIHWGNYLSIFLARHPEFISTLYWTQLPPTGDPPDFSPCEDVPPHELPLHLMPAPKMARPPSSTWIWISSCGAGSGMTTIRSTPTRTCNTLEKAFGSLTNPAGCGA